MNLASPALKIFNSKNNYFDQPAKKLQENKNKIERYLVEMKGMNEFQVKIYLDAYDYFVVNPDEYDGATMTQDLKDIENLELTSMLHDFLYIKYSCAGNLKYRYLSDKLFRSQMIFMGKSSWNGGARFVLLTLIILIHTPYSFLFKNRKMSQTDKNTVDGIYNVLCHRTPRKWYREFSGELTWLVILILSIIFILN